MRPPDAMSRQLKLKLRDEEDEDIEGVFEQAQVHSSHGSAPSAYGGDAVVGFEEARRVTRSLMPRMLLVGRGGVWRPCSLFQVRGAMLACSGSRR